MYLLLLNFISEKINLSNYIKSGAPKIYFDKVQVVLELVIVIWKELILKFYIQKEIFEYLPTIEEKGT